MAYIMKAEHGFDLPRRLQIELLLAKGEVAAAEASLREALQVASRQQALLFELRAGTGLAKLLQARGDGKEAHALLSGIYSRFTEGSTTKVLTDASALIEELSRV